MTSPDRHEVGLTVNTQSSHHNHHNSSNSSSHNHNHEYKKLLRSCFEDENEDYSSLENLLFENDQEDQDGTHRDSHNNNDNNKNDNNKHNKSASQSRRDFFATLQVTGTGSTETASLSSDDDACSKCSSSSSSRHSSSTTSTHSTMERGQPIQPGELQSPLLTEWKARFQRATQQRKQLSLELQALQQAQQDQQIQPRRISTAATGKNASQEGSSNTRNAPVTPTFTPRRGTPPKTPTLIPHHSASTPAATTMATPKSVRFASKLISPPTTRYLDYVTATTPSSTSLLLSPPSQSTASSPGPLLLSAQQVIDLQDRNTVLEQAWIQQQESARNLETQLEALHKLHDGTESSSPSVVSSPHDVKGNTEKDKETDTDTETKSSLHAIRLQIQLQHAREVRFLKQMHAQQLEQLQMQRDQQLQQMKQEMSRLEAQLSSRQSHVDQLEQYQSQMANEYEQLMEENKQLHRKVVQSHSEQQEIGQLQLEAERELQLLNAENSDLHEALKVQEHQLKESQAQCEIFLLREQEREEEIMALRKQLIMMQQDDPSLVPTEMQTGPTTITGHEYYPQKELQDKQLEQQEPHHHHHHHQQSTLKYSASFQDQSLLEETNAEEVRERLFLSNSIQNSQDDDSRFFQKLERNMNAQMMNATLQLSQLDSQDYTTKDSEIIMSTSSASWVEAQSPTKLSMTLQALSPIFPDNEQQEKSNESPILIPQSSPLDHHRDFEQRMARETTRLIDRFHQMRSPQANPSHTDTSVHETGLDGDSQILDATLDLLHKIKDFVTSSSEDEDDDNNNHDDDDDTQVGASEPKTRHSPQETSLLETLEVLNNLMGFDEEHEDTQDGLSLLTLTMLEQNGHDGVNDEGQELSHHSVLTRRSAISSTQQRRQYDDCYPDPIQPWKELVMQLRRQVEAVEYDRAELVRTTGEYWNDQHSIHQYEVDAASVAAYRKGYEEGVQRTINNLCIDGSQPQQEVG